MNAIQFTGPWKAELVKIAAPEAETEIETICSVISAGTEMAVLSGGESWAPLPFIPGYGSVGRITRDGSGMFSKGDLVFTYGTHSEFSKVDTVCIPLTKDCDPVKAVFARMAAVSMTALRTSSIELGDRVVVIGAGIVGNFAAQLAGLSGASVSVIDPSDFRREAAVSCGIQSVFSSISEIPGDYRFNTVIDATGSPEAIIEASALVANQGELILLGSPRGKYWADVTQYLNRIHLCPVCMTVKGAHEWKFPVHPSPENFYKHSIERNLKYLLKAIAAEVLRVAPLLTDVVTPEEAPGIYNKLIEKQQDCLGAVIRWKEL